MNITFISDLRDMTYTHYLNQPKSTIEWKLNEKISRKPDLIKTLRYISYRLIRKYKSMYPQKKIKILLKSYQVNLYK